LLKANTLEGSAFSNLQEVFWLKRFLNEVPVINELISKPFLIQQKAFNFDTPSSDALSQMSGGLSDMSEFTVHKPDSDFNVSIVDNSNSKLCSVGEGNNSMMNAAHSELAGSPKKQNLSQVEEVKVPLTKLT